MAGVPVRRVYWAKISAGVGSGRMKMYRIPVSEIQSEDVDLGVGRAISIHVSEPTALGVATGESAECVCMRGINPYSDMVEFASYSQTSVLYMR